MPILKLVRLLGTVAVFASAPALAMAQTQPSPSPPPAPPPATKPAPSTDPAQKPPTDRTTPDRSATKALHPLIGLAVVSSDGTRLGTVDKVDAEPDGKVKAIHIKTGGFLGFGGKIVAVPEGKFARSGVNIQLRMTAEEVSKLPEVKEQS